MLVERIISIATIIFASFFLIMALQLESRPSVVINPGAWPIFLTVMMIILGFVLTIRNFKGQKKSDQSNLAENAQDEVEAQDELIYPRNFIYLMGTLILYVSLLGYLGFIVATSLVVFVLSGLFGIRKWFNRVITAIVSTAGFVLLFPIILNLPFPRGEGIFRMLSSLFY